MPLFFSGKINDIDFLISSIFAFIVFSMVASAVYILNDIRDISIDSIHPRKKFRPIASGEISKDLAIRLMGILLCVSILLSMLLLTYQSLIIIIIYFVLNVAYSYYLKNLLIIDLIVIALGFVLRLFLGSTVSDSPLSYWIVIMTFLLAIFLGLGKRRDDVLLFIYSGKKMRKVVDEYNIKYIDNAMIIFATTIVIVYFLFATSSEVQSRMNSSYIFSTTIFVILGLLRYLQLSFINQNTGSPVSIVLKDKFIQIMIFLWVSFYVNVIYL